MKQINQSYKTGEMKLDEVPSPQFETRMVIAETKASLVSAGTEKNAAGSCQKIFAG